MPSVSSSGTSSKKALVYSSVVQQAPGYVWRWRSDDGKEESAESFPYYHDCLADARAKGYEVDLASAHGNTAPGGSPHKLD